MPVEVCSLHIEHGAFQAGAIPTNWGLNPILKGTFNLLHESVKHKSGMTILSLWGDRFFPVFQ